MTIDFNGRTAPITNAIDCGLYLPKFIILKYFPKFCYLCAAYIALAKSTISSGVRSYDIITIIYGSRASGESEVRAAPTAL